MTIVFILVLCAIAIVLAAGLSAKFQQASQQPPAGSFLSVKPLSDPEQVLYWRLKEAMPECVVLGQVSFSRFIRPLHHDASSRLALFNRISRKTVDFLVCLPDFTVVAAVELDDKSHSVAKDAQRDAILQAADVPLVRVNVCEMPSAEQLRAIFTR